jgi:hypothetical protein
MRKRSHRRYSATALALPRRRLMNGVGIWLASLAILLQTFVVQTHVDSFGVQPELGRGSIAAPVALDRGVSVSAQSDDASAPCVICQAMATAGNSLVSEPAHLGVLLGDTVVEPFLIFACVMTRPSHAWRSRAPPLHP